VFGPVPGTQTKKATRGPKRAPNGINAAAINGRVDQDAERN
jgi:hypothetical protein